MTGRRSTCFAPHRELVGGGAVDRVVTTPGGVAGRLGHANAVVTMMVYARVDKLVDGGADRVTAIVAFAAGLLLVLS